MVEWLTVLALLIFGLAVVVVEIIFIPGTTIVGLGGIILMIIGLGLSFNYFGSATGWTTTALTFVGSGLTLYLAFRANVWRRFSLKTSIDSKVNEGELAGLQPGTEGTTLSNLRPVGKAELNARAYEVRTLGNFMDAGTRVRVVQIKDNQIIVEQVS